MAKSMFQSYKGSLIFAGSTLLGVALLVGSEDREGALVVAASELERQSELVEQQNAFSAPEGSSTDRSERRSRQMQPLDSSAFTPDEELIDDTQGFDPTPPDNSYGGYSPAWEKAQIVDREFEISIE
ncbi:MAG: hypothetical protein ABJ239_01415 [Erythrobacter sp.]